MKQIFKSKIGPEILLIVIVPFVCMFSFAYADGRIWPILGILVPLMLFVASIIFGTSYTIDGVELVIRAGLIRYDKIDINKIRKIEKSNTWVSSPAASMDRIEIFYSKYDSIAISPKDRQRFIDELLKINPEIEVNVK